MIFLWFSCDQSLPEGTKPCQKPWTPRRDPPNVSESIVQVAWTRHRLPQLLVASAARNANAALHGVNEVLPVLLHPQNLFKGKTNHGKIRKQIRELTALTNNTRYLFLYQQYMEIQHTSGLKESGINQLYGSIMVHLSSFSEPDESWIMWSSQVWLNMGEHTKIIQNNPTWFERTKIKKVSLSAWII